MRNALSADEQEHAKDFADADAAQVSATLDAVPGAWERTQEGLAQAAEGEGTPLDELV